MEEKGGTGGVVRELEEWWGCRRREGGWLVEGNGREKLGMEEGRRKGGEEVDRGRERGRYRDRRME